MKKNKPRYKKGRVKKALKRVNKRVGGFSPIKKAAIHITVISAISSLIF